jgi:hypothetical protein
MDTIVKELEFGDSGKYCLKGNKIGQLLRAEYLVMEKSIIEASRKSGAF